MMHHHPSREAIPISQLCIGEFGMKLAQSLTSASAVLLSFACVVGAPSIANAQAAPLVAADSSTGSIELGNTGANDAQTPNATEPTQAQSEPAAAQESAQAEPVKDPREQYRDLVLQQSNDNLAGTSSAARRYKKVDLSTLRANAIGAQPNVLPSTAR
jgi:hypothetical protein